MPGHGSHPEAHRCRKPDDFRIPSDGRVFRGLDVSDCTLSGVIGSLTERASPENRVRLERARITNCVAGACYLRDCTLIDVDIDGLDVPGPAVMLEGCFLQRVRFSRVSGRFIISPRGYAGASVDRSMAAEYERSDDWAADVSDVWGPFEMRHVPPQTVIIDPGHQAFVNTEQIARTSGWEDYLRDNYFYRDIAAAVHVNDPYVLLSASRGDRELAAARESLAQLETYGLLLATYPVSRQLR